MVYVCRMVKYGIAIISFECIKGPMLILYWGNPNTVETFIFVGLKFSGFQVSHKLVGI